MRAALLRFCIPIAACCALAVAGAQIARRPATRVDLGQATAVTVRQGLAPNVLGLSRTEAIRRLRSAGLRAKLVDSTTANRADSVVRQSPDAGKPLRDGPYVTLVIGRQPASPPTVAPVAVTRLTDPYLSTTAVSRTLQPVRVPRLIGLSYRGAVLSLTSAGLLIGDTRREYSDEQVAGQVFHQDPPPGSIRMPKARVDLTFSMGPHARSDTVSVPYLIGATIEGARDSLVRTGLLLGHVDSTVQIGGSRRITEQHPPEKVWLHRNDSVRVTIIVPTKPRPVPSVVSLSLDSAQWTLANLGFLTGTVRIEERAGIAEVVTAQYPSAGVPTATGSPVSLVVNHPPPVRHVTMPKLIGSSRPAAEALVRNAGLEIGEIVQRVADPRVKVVDQKPLAGSRVLERSRVVFTLDTLPSPQASSNLRPVPPQVSLSGPDLVRVPPVRGDELTTARDTLAAAGIDTVIVDGAFAPGAVVDSQFPEANTLVPRGTPLTLVLVPNLIRVVPRLIGLTFDSASVVAARSDFTLSVITRIRALTAHTTVDFQVPDDGTQTVSSADIGVMLRVPLVPPLAAAAGLLATLVGVGLVATPRFRRGARTPPPGVTLRYSPGDPQLPTLELEQATLVRNALEIRFSARMETPVLTCEESSLIRKERWLDG